MNSLSDRTRSRAARRRDPRYWESLPRVVAAFLFASTLAYGQADEDPTSSELEDEVDYTEAIITESTDESDETPTVNFLGLEAAPLKGTLVTDRPDFTESTLTIPRGRFQLEAGYTFTSDKEDGVRAKDHTFPELLLRVGLVDDVELRIGWSGWSLSREEFRERNEVGRTVKMHTRDNGGTDMNVGFKFHLLDRDGWAPDFAVLVGADLPTGASGKTSGDVDPNLGLLWAYDLSDDMSLAGNVNFAVPTSEKGRFFQTSASVSLGYSLTDDLGAYFEYYGFYNNDRNTDAAHYANGGFTYLITDNFQFDVRVGAGLNEEADDLFVGTGFAWRF